VCISFGKCNYTYCLFLQNYNRFKSCSVGVTPNNFPRIDREIWITKFANPMTIKCNFSEFLVTHMYRHFGKDHVHIHFIHVNVN